MTYFKSMKHKKLKIFLCLLVLAALTLLFIYLYQRQDYYFSFLSSHGDQVRHWAGQHTLLAVSLLILGQVIQVFMAIIPAGPLQMAAGYAFGTFYGTLISALGSALGSILVYSFVKIYGKKWITFFLSEEKLDKFMPEKLDRKWELLMTLIYLIPGSPKDIITYIAGLTETHPALWIFLFLFGRIPSILAASLSGHALGNQQYKMALLSLAAIGLLSSIGYIIYKKLMDKKDTTYEEIIKKHHKTEIGG